MSARRYASLRMQTNFVMGCLTFLYSDEHGCTSIKHPVT